MPPTSPEAAGFAFDLPADRVAQHPARPRDAARLLHVSAAGLHGRIVRDLPDLLRRGDLLVVNDTRVVPAQLHGMRAGAGIGITLDRPLPDGTWHALARNARRLRVNDVIRFAGGLEAEVRQRHPDGGVVLIFNREGAALAEAIRGAGALALPPYIVRPHGPTSDDAADYQTAFAARDGAVAAPTAALHFSPALLAALAERGVGRVAITLHVGAGTFLPLRGDPAGITQLHAERGTIGADAARAINAARAAGGRIVAVGTTVLRLLESACDDTGAIKPFDGLTDIFIRPGHRFRTADLLMTNFHLPGTSLILLVCAFAGTERMRMAYAHAIAEKYRFYSYGDASLLERG